MNYMWIIGMLMYAGAGALLHDVPFLRYVSAILLVATGTIFGILSKGV